MKRSNIKCVKHWICLLHVGRLSHTGADCWNARLFIAYEIIKFSIIIVIMGILSVSLTYFFNIYKARIQSKLIFEMLNTLICNLQKADYYIFSKYNYAYLQKRINIDVDKIWSFFFDSIVNSFFRILTMIITISVIGNINLKLLLLILIVTPLYIIAYCLLKKPIYKKSTNLKEAQASFYQQLSEQFEFVKVIKIWVSYSFNKSKREKCFKDYLSKFMTYVKLQHLYNSLEGILSICFKVTALIIGGFEIMVGNLTLGSFTIIVSYFGMLVESIKFFFSFGQSYQEATNSYDRICEITSLDKEKFGTLKASKKINSINIKSIFFNYDNHPVFKDFSACFNIGINIIQGDNGSGKTTLILLLCGLLHAKNNNIFYNDYLLSDLDIEYLRKNKLSIYLQNQEWSKVTAQEMLFEALNLESNEIEQLIYKNKLMDLYISKSFDIRLYFKRPLTELSGGEVQRLYLLPALIKDSDIFILDEPTSDLDHESKEVLTNILYKKSRDKIIIIVTHEKYLFNNKKGIHIVQL